MRAKIRPLARGLSALAAVGVAVVVMSAGASSVSAARAPHATRIADTAATQNVVSSAPGDWTWN